jgi:anti-sigma factor RsiW
MTPPQWSEDLLSAYLDGELDAETRSAVETHLADRPEWRDVLGDVGAARDAVRGLPELDLSPDAWSHVLANVAADDASPVTTVPGVVRGLRSRVRRAPTRWAGLGAAVAAAAVVVAVVFVPGPSRVTPKVATFATEHSARASMASDPVSSLAGVSIMRGLGR